MIDKKLLEVLSTPPDAALTIVTQGAEGPHAVNTWNSYVLVCDEGKLWIPAGRMHKTEANIRHNDRVLLTISNREVMGKTYRGTGFLVKGKACFGMEGEEADRVRQRFPWARAVLTITVLSSEQTL